MFLISFQTAYALEINTYPPILGYTITEASTFTDYVSYAFMFLIAISTVILVAVIILGGIDFILAGGSPGKASQAKKKIKDGFIGMIILLLCYVILNTINPGIIGIEEPGLEKCLGGGIIITIDKLGFPTKKMCIYDSMSRLDIDGTVTKTEWTYKEGDLKEVWVYSDYDFKNPIGVLFQDNSHLTDGPMPGGDVPSNTKSIFILKDYPGLYLYDLSFWETEKYPPFYVGLRDFKDLNNVPIDLNHYVGYDNLTTSFCFIYDKSYPEMSYRAIFFEDTNYTGQCFIVGWRHPSGRSSTKMSKIGFIPYSIPDNSLSSVITYKADESNDYGKIILYNKTNCVSEDSAKDQCELNVADLEGYNDVSPWEQCPSFEGDVKSVVIQGKAGFVVRATDGYCMYFDVERNKGNNCVNLENTRVFYESGCAEEDPDTGECIKPVNIRPKEVIPLIID